MPTGGGARSVAQVRKGDALANLPQNVRGDVAT
jgi:hypothetical protein